VLYVSANSDYGCTLYAVNPSTGETLWENDSCPYEFISTRYTQSDGMLYFFDYYTLTALDVQTGDEVWRYELDNEVEHAPEVYKDTIFVWDYEYPDDNFSRITLHALDRRSGVKKWTFRGFSEGLGCLRSERPITVEDGTIYLMASVSAPVEGEFYANYALTTLDAETGRTLWIYDEGPGSLFDVVVLGDEVYFGFRPDEEYGEHFLMILDAATGETVMRMEMRDLGNITTDGERIYTLSSESLLTGERADEVLTSLEFFDH
jgi:outer membrane protein assembly factor BamB